MDLCGSKSRGAWLFPLIAAVGGCGDSADTPVVGDATGGIASTLTGGLASSGGQQATGGRIPGSGGQVSTGGQAASGGAEQSGGQMGTGGLVATGGSAASGGSIGSGGQVVTGGAEATGGTDLADLPKFSFFVTSLPAMERLSGSPDGFGGDLGGLAGADNICQMIAESVGFGAKTWRAFLSVTDGGDGEPVHAIDRIGQGPWYDANQRLIAEDISGLLNDRPDGDPIAVADLANENGEGQKQFGDNHDTLTGTNDEGRLDSDDPADTCNDWTSTTVDPSGIRLGHSWPRNQRSGVSWLADHSARSCAAGVNLEQNGGGDGSSVGAGGGYGGIYCFALQP